MGIFQCEQHGGLELRKEFVEILRPDFVFGHLGADGDVGKPTIAAVVDEHAIAGIGDMLRQRLHVVERAAPARRERDPRAGAAEDLVIDVHSAHLGDGHGVLRVNRGHFIPGALAASRATWPTCVLACVLR